MKSTPDNEFLNLYGWNEFLASALTDLLGRLSSQLSADQLRLGRIVCEERKLYCVQTSLTESLWAAVSSKMVRDASARPDFPAVGDWVVFEEPVSNERGVIHQIVPRKSILVRKQVGDSVDVQILSTNVDYVFVTSSLNEDLNFRRIERFLTVAREGGATPILLLTKADLLGEGAEEFIEEAKAEFPGLSVHPLSHSEFEHAQFFKDYLKRGTTSIFLGSSGVGKSTIVNFLIGAVEDSDQIAVQEVREKDGKGRHTTTSRNLYVSLYGGLIIDTPGMREVQLSAHEEGISSQFPDVEELLLKCRFTNCKHANEPGCAIRGALANEALTEERWASYQKLEAEISSRRAKKEKTTVTDDRQVWKKVTHEARGRSLRKPKS